MQIPIYKIRSISNNIKEAVHWRKETKQEVIKWLELNNAEYKFEILSFNQDPELIIKTLEGEYTVPYDWWIIKGIKNEFYPCKNEIFHLTYEILDKEQKTLIIIEINNRHDDLTQARWANLVYVIRSGLSGFPAGVRVLTEYSTSHDVCYQSVCWLLELSSLHPIEIIKNQLIKSSDHFNNIPIRWTICGRTETLVS